MKPAVSDGWPAEPVAPAAGCGEVGVSARAPQGWPGVGCPPQTARGSPGAGRALRSPRPGAWNVPAPAGQTEMSLELFIYLYCTVFQKGWKRAWKLPRLRSSSSSSQLRRRVGGLSQGQTPAVVLTTRNPPIECRRLAQCHVRTGLKITLSSLHGHPAARANFRSPRENETTASSWERSAASVPITAGVVIATDRPTRMTQPNKGSPEWEPHGHQAQPSSQGGGRLDHRPPGRARRHHGGCHSVRLFGKNYKSQVTAASGGARGRGHGGERVPRGRLPGSEPPGGSPGVYHILQITD